MTRVPDEVSRLWAHIDIKSKDECWPWLRGRGAKGYGRFRDKNSVIVFAHRAAFEFVNGPVPEGYSVCHSCDNPWCCNPRHLWAGTHGDNMRDSFRKGRNRPPPNESKPKGEECPWSTLTEADVRRIRAAFKDLPEGRNGKKKYGTVAGLARTLGISLGQVLSIAKRKTWAHVVDSKHAVRFAETFEAKMPVREEA